MYRAASVGADAIVPGEWESVVDSDINTALNTAIEALVIIETTVQTVAFTAETNYRYPCDTDTTAAFTVTLPGTPTAGDVVYVFDVAGTFDVAHLTLDGQTKKIMSDASDLIIDVKWFSGGVQFVNDVEGWVVI